MDIASWNKWVDYSKARDVMFEHTDTDVGALVCG